MTSAPTSGPMNMTQKIGFAGVSQWIALDVDNEPFIFRRFDELAARNLLYRQSEIIAIERRLEKLDNEDVDNSQRRDFPKLLPASRWEGLVESVENGDESAKQRMELILESRQKVDDYHDALLRQKEILDMKRPGTRTVKAFKHWLLDSCNLGGVANTFLDDTRDLAALRSTRDADYLSILMRRYWPAEVDANSQGVGRFSEKHIETAVALVNVLVAAVLLVGSITTLYFVQRDGVKLGLVGAFTALFASSMGFMTSARKAEVFGATAAYAAVLVVFVSGEISNSKT